MPPYPFHIEIWLRLFEMIAETISGFRFRSLTRARLAVLYLFSVVCPPLAVLLVGKPVQAMLNLVLCLLLYVPGLIHALMVVADHKANKRNAQLVNAVRSRR